MFSPHKSDTGAVVPFEYVPALAGTYQAGQMLTMSGGYAKPLGAATKTTPPYLCMANITVTDSELVPVTRVKNDVIYETQLTAESSIATVGEKLQVSASGLGVDGGATGTFEIVYMEGIEEGATVRGRFV